MTRYWIVTHMVFKSASSILSISFWYHPTYSDMYFRYLLTLCPRSRGSSCLNSEKTSLSPCRSSGLALSLQRSSTGLSSIHSLSFNRPEDPRPGGVLPTHSSRCDIRCLTLRSAYIVGHCVCVLSMKGKTKGSDFRSRSRVLKGVDTRYFNLSMAQGIRG